MRRFYFAPLTPRPPPLPPTLLPAPQSVQESSAALHRSCLEQLETIKTQYYTFLSMFHPGDASADSALAGGSAGSARSPSGSALSSHLQSSLNEDISTLKRRLENLSAGTLRPFAPEGYGRTYATPRS